MKIRACMDRELFIAKEYKMMTEEQLVRRLKIIKQTEETKMEFKKWTKEEVDKFCENNWIDTPDWLYDFVNDLEASIEMDDSKNPEGDLVVVIKGKEN